MPREPSASRETRDAGRGIERGPADGGDTAAGRILTIGHSNHPQEVFAALLSQHGVTALADLRSVPYSRFNPQFNRKRLAARLEAAGIRYLYLGEELGGRPPDPACYEDGRIRYERVARTGRFQEGLARAAEAAADHRLVLMCAEREPLDCHRTLLVARALDARGVPVAHIHGDGALEPHGRAMDRLIGRLGLDADGDLFHRRSPREALIADAVSRQADRLALRRSAPAKARKGGRDRPAGARGGD